LAPIVLAAAVAAREAAVPPVFPVVAVVEVPVVAVEALEALVRVVADLAIFETQVDTVILTNSVKFSEQRL
jgi:hypothetical protein